MADDTPLTEARLNELKALANGATPGPWTVAIAGDLFDVALRDDEGKGIARIGMRSQPQTAPDAAYIAALDPSTVHALIQLALSGLRGAEDSARLDWFAAQTFEHTPSGIELKFDSETLRNAIDAARSSESSRTPADGRGGDDE